MAIFFDVIIIMLLVVPLMLLVLLLHHLFIRQHSPWHGHHEKAFFLGTLLLLFYVVISWGSFIEPQLLTVKHETLEIGLDKPVRIALLADTQVGPYKRAYFVEKIARKLEKIDPDAVVFAGDFVMNNISSPSDEVFMLQPLSRVAAHIPFYGVLGNHEYGYGEPSLTLQTYDVHAVVHDTLESFGIDVLVDEERVIELNGERLRLVGLDDLWGSAFRVKQLSSSSLPTVAVTHNPDTVYYLEPGSVDVLLTGHTHGGQIRLPLVGPLAHANTRLPLRYYKGFSFINGIPLYVTGGVGESGARARLFNLPEITILELN